jgi:hypothetical protein
MDAKLKKIGDNFILTLNNPKEYTNELQPLSLKNCLKVVNNYDLDEMATEYAEKRKELDIPYANGLYYGFLEGFQKALELMGDKKYSEEDVRNAYFNGEKDSYVKGGQTKEMQNEFIQSLKQTEWDVEIEMRSKDIDELRESGEGFLNNKNLYIPKLDEDGCLIIKRK